MPKLLILVLFCSLALAEARQLASVAPGWVMFKDSQSLDEELKAQGIRRASRFSFQIPDKSTTIGEIPEVAVSVAERKDVATLLEYFAGEDTSGYQDVLAHAGTRGEKYVRLSEVLPIFIRERLACERCQTNKCANSALSLSNAATLPDPDATRIFSDYVHGEFVKLKNGDSLRLGDVAVVWGKDHGGKQAVRSAAVFVGESLFVQKAKDGAQPPFRFYDFSGLTKGSGKERTVSFHRCAVTRRPE